MNEYSFSQCGHASSGPAPVGRQAAPPRPATSATRSCAPRPRCSRRTASSSRRSPTSPGSPASRPAPSTSTSRARTTCWSRSSSASMKRRHRRRPRGARRRRPTRRERLRPHRPPAPRSGSAATRDLAVVFQVELRQSVEVHGALLVDATCRTTSSLIREAIADGQQSGAVPQGHQRHDRHQDLLRRARRDGHQLDAEPAQVRRSKPKPTRSSTSSSTESAAGARAAGGTA